MLEPYRYRQDLHNPDRYLIDVNDDILEVYLEASKSPGDHDHLHYIIVRGDAGIKYAVKFYSKDPVALLTFVVNSIVQRYVKPENLSEFVYALGGYAPDMDGLPAPTPPNQMLN